MCKIKYFIKITLSNSSRLIEIIFQGREEDDVAYPFPTHCLYGPFTPRNSS